MPFWPGNGPEGRAIQPCANGYLALTDWWDGWCGDERDNFWSNKDYGVMESNAVAARWLLGGGAIRSGFLDLELYFDSNKIPTGGGVHIFSLTSGHDALGTPRGNPFYPGWLRFDFEVNNAAGIPYLQVGVYNADAEGRAWFRRGNSVDVVIAEIPLDIVLVPQTWLPLSIRWETFGSNMVLTCNGVSSPVYPHPHSAPIAALSAGNIDDIDGAVRFRNMTWGPLPNHDPV